MMKWVFSSLIGHSRNSQGQLQSPQAALACAQSPNFNSLRPLLWLTGKEHDKGHWRKRARVEEGAENLNRKRSPKHSQLSNCWFLAWKRVSSPAPLLYCVAGDTQMKATLPLWNARALLTRSTTLCLLWEKGWNWGHSPGVSWLTSGKLQLKCLLDLQFLGVSAPWRWFLHLISAASQ